MGADVAYIPCDPHVSLRNYRGLSVALKAYDPDVVHIHLDTFYMPLWALLHNKRTVFTIHSQPYRLFEKKIIRSIFKALIKKKRFTLVGVSDKISEEAAALLHVNPSRVKTVYNPVKTVDYAPHESDGAVTFVNVARFHHIKNHALLLHSFKRVCDSCPSAMLKLAGEGELLEPTKMLAAELGLTDRIVFLGNVSDVYPLLSQSDVFVLSSDSEAMPISVLEAMACSLPIVATAVGGVPELVGEDNGLLVPQNDEAALADAMIKMALDSTLRHKCGRASFERAASYNVEKITQAYTTLYFEAPGKERIDDANC
jgi:glycosyltransferase involved in cell wall biosynthesis